MISLIIPFYSHADEQNSGIYTFNGQELAWVIVDTDGEIIDSYDPADSSVRSVTQKPYITLANGQKAYFYNSDNYYSVFTFVANQHVQLAAFWSSATSFASGYCLEYAGNGTTTIFESGSIPMPVDIYSFDAPRTGSYVFWVMNTSVDAKVLETFMVTST